MIHESSAQKDETTAYQYDRWSLGKLSLSNDPLKHQEKQKLHNGPTRRLYVIKEAPAAGKVNTKQTDHAKVAAYSRVIWGKMRHGQIATLLESYLTFVMSGGKTSRSMGMKSELSLSLSFGFPVVVSVATKC